MLLITITVAVVILGMCALAWHASTQVLDFQDRLGPHPLLSASSESFNSTRYAAQADPVDRVAFQL